MRQVYRLLGLVRRYGPGPAETACARALDLDVVYVTKNCLDAGEGDRVGFVAAVPCGGRRAPACRLRAEDRSWVTERILIDGGGATTR